MIDRDEDQGEIRPGRRWRNWMQKDGAVKRALPPKQLETTYD